MLSAACNVDGGGLDNDSQNDDVDLNSVMMESVRENENHRERVEETSSPKGNDAHLRATIQSKKKMERSIS